MRDIYVGHAGGGFLSETKDAGAELDEGYNGQRPKDPKAKKHCCLDHTRPSGGKVGLCGRKRHAIKREHSAVLDEELREYQRKIQRIINR